MGTILDLPVTSSTTLTAEQVIGYSWHPTNTTPKLFWKEYTGNAPLATGDYYFGDGTLGFSAFKSGTGSSWTPVSAAVTGRIGVHEIGIGTSTGALSGGESCTNDSSYSFGDGEIRIGAIVSISDVPDATNEDYSFYIGAGNQVGGFHTSGVFWHLDAGVNATNWICRSRGSSVNNADSGLAFDTSWITLEIIVAADLSSVKYYANSTLYHTETTAANIPSAGDEVNWQHMGHAAATTQVNKYLIDKFWVVITPTNTSGSITTWIGE